MKVLIIGAGLSGLSTALALRRYIPHDNNGQLEIKIYDRADPHDTGVAGWNDHADLRLKNQGAAISLQANALRVLQYLDPKLAERVRASGFPCRGFSWKTAGNWMLGREVVELLPISRPVLVGCLMDALPKDVRVEYRTVVGVEMGAGRRPVVRFEDGETEEADLVVGADGIRSVVREGLFGGEEELKPRYLGHCAVGGVLDRNIALPQSYLSDPTIMFFEGAQGFFGYCGLSQAEPNKILYFSVYDSDLPDRKNLDYQKINTQLRERHADFGDPIVEQCLREAVIDNVYPICWVPDLPHWGRDGCVLVGDAAHAMSPASGQGGSQAFEDAQSLALLLAHYLKANDVNRATEQSLKAFYNFRHKRVDAMKAKGLSLKEPDRPWSVGMTALVYVALFVTMQVKYLAGFFSTADPVRDWDGEVEVKKYLAAE